MIPMACTLSADDLRARLQRIRDLGRSHLLAQERRSRELRLRYSPQARDELRDVVRLENQCCAFLEFALEESEGALVLTIRAPEEAGESAVFLFEHFAGEQGASTAP